jgi:hypothetical protein
MSKLSATAKPFIPRALQRAPPVTPPVTPPVAPPVAPKTVKYPCECKKNSEIKCKNCLFLIGCYIDCQCSRDHTGYCRQCDKIEADADAFEFGFYDY